MQKQEIAYLVDIISDTVASLKVTKTERAIALFRTGKVGFHNLSMEPHKLGLREAPLFEIEQPISPDDPWEITPRSDGKPVDELLISNPELGQWVQKAGVTRGLGVLEALPIGDYYLVRSKLKPMVASWISVGNDVIPGTPNTRVLLDAGMVKACIIGSNADEPPLLDVPLIGVVILNQTGLVFPAGSKASAQHGVIFFSFAPPAVKKATYDSDLLLVIPSSGELFLDNVYRTEADLEDHKKSVIRWQTEFLPSFVTACAARK